MPYDIECFVESDVTIIRSLLFHTTSQCIHMPSHELTIYIISPDAS